MFTALTMVSVSTVLVFGNYQIQALYTVSFDKLQGQIFLAWGIIEELAFI